MAEDSMIESEDENILYDLLVITEWAPETDTQVSQLTIATCFQFLLWVGNLTFISYKKNCFQK